jgi:hypothetical protein
VKKQKTFSGLADSGGNVVCIGERDIAEDNYHAKNQSIYSKNLCGTDHSGITHRMWNRENSRLL